MAIDHVPAVHVPPLGERVPRRAVLAGGVAAGLVLGAGQLGAGLLGSGAAAGAPSILKPLPPERFTDFGTNAEMRWESVDPRRYLTPQADLFVRNHTATPRVDPATYRLRVFGDGLREARNEARAHELSLRDLRRLPVTRILGVHECTGNGRSFFRTQQGQSVSGTAWTLGSVGAVVWEGVRLRDVLRSLGVRGDAVSVQATGLDAPFVSGGTDYGRVRRPFPVQKALDDALLAWGGDGEALLPDHGYPLRLVLPGWVGIASIKWLGSLEISRGQLTSPWNTTFYRMTGGGYPPDSPPLTVNPVRSALELPWRAALPRRPELTLTGRSWSGLAPVRRVEVSTDGGERWTEARLERRGGVHGRGGTRAVRGHGWTRWSHSWRRPTSGEHEVLVRATDQRGRTQPLETPYNDAGYFFDAVVRHPVTVG
ncbi:molybdopterin-dependent oxidoreductase [Nocardioides nanhaiensis]